MYAKYTATVTLVSANSQEESSFDITYNEVPEEKLPELENESGWIFSGWYYGDTFIAEINATDPFTLTSDNSGDDIMLYAKWIYYADITDSLNGKTNCTIIAGLTLNECIGDILQGDYEVDGWQYIGLVDYYNKTDTFNSSDLISGTSIVDFGVDYSFFALYSCGIAINIGPNGNVSQDDLTVYLSYDVSGLDECDSGTYSGYSFSYWMAYEISGETLINLVSDGEEESTVSTGNELSAGKEVYDGLKVSYEYADYVIYAVYTINEYTLRYFDAEDQSLESITAENTTDLLTVYTDRDVLAGGYVIYSETANGRTICVDTLTSEKDGYHVVWLIYIYDAESGEYLFSDEFDGLAETDGYIILPSGLYGDIALGYTYAGNDYTINFVTAGNGEVESITVAYSSEYDLSDIVVPYPDLYTFTAWYYTNDDGDEVEYDNIGIYDFIGDLTLTAHYATSVYIANYNGEVKTIEYGSSGYLYYTTQDVDTIRPDSAWELSSVKSEDGSVVLSVVIKDDGYYIEYTEFTFSVSKFVAGWSRDIELELPLGFSMSYNFITVYYGQDYTLPLQEEITEPSEAEGWYLYGWYNSVICDDLFALTAELVNNTDITSLTCRYYTTITVDGSYITTSSDGSSQTETCIYDGYIIILGDTLSDSVSAMDWYTEWENTIKELLDSRYYFSCWALEDDTSVDEITLSFYGKTIKAVYKEYDGRIIYSGNEEITFQLDSGWNGIKDSVLAYSVDTIGYTFEGWSRVADGSINDLLDENDLVIIYAALVTDHTLTLYPVYTENSYTIQFVVTDVNNNETVYTINDVYTTDSFSVQFGQYDTENKYVIVSDPDGYNITGWTLNGDSANKIYENKYNYTLTDILKSEPLDATITFSAVKEAILYTITYENLKGNNASGFISSYTIESNDIALPTGLTATGYEFKGWVVATEEGEYTEEEIVRGSFGDIKYTAWWQLIPYTITYENLKGNDASGFISSYTIESEDITLPTGLTAVGYEFKGWVVATEEGNIVTAIVKGSDGDITYTAWWELIYYTIEYNNVKDHDVSSFTNEYTVESDAVNLNTIYASWHVNTGWTDADGNTLTEIGISCASDDPEVKVISVYAEWDAVTYTLSFTDASGNVVDTTTYTIDEGNEAVEYYTPEVPSKDYCTGYWYNLYEIVPVDWTIDYSTALDYWTALNTSDDKVITITCYYVVTPYTVTYVGIDDAVLCSVTYVVEDGDISVLDTENYYDAFAQEAPDVDCYTFTEWQVNGTQVSATQEISSSEVVSVIKNNGYGNIQIVAVYTAKTYTVYFYSYGNSLNSESEIEYTVDDTVINIPASYESDGYIYYYETSSDWYYQQAKECAGSTFNVYQQRCAIEYIISIEADGETHEYSYSADVLTDDNLVLIILAEGTYIDENGTKYEVSDDRLLTIYNIKLGNHTLIKCDSSSYIVLNLDFGSSTKTYLFASQDKLKAFSLPVAEKEGYIFGGWYYNETLATDYLETYSANSGDVITFTAKWTAISYTVRYINIDNNGGTEDVSCTYGEALTLKEYTVEGYTLTGYSYNGVIYTGEVGNLTSTDGAVVELTAVWNVNYYTIMFNTDGGEYEDSCFVSYDEYVILPEAQKVGYTFSGWVYGAESYVAGTVVSRLSAQNGGVVQFTAQYTPITYTVQIVAGPYETVFANNGISLSATISYDEEYTLPEISSAAGTTVSGYVFGSYTATIGGNTVEVKNGGTIKNLTYTYGAIITFEINYKTSSYEVSFSDSNTVRYTIEDDYIVEPEIVSVDSSGAYGWSSYQLSYDESISSKKESYQNGIAVIFYIKNYGSEYTAIAYRAYESGTTQDGFADKAPIIGGEAVKWTYVQDTDNTSLYYAYYTIGQIDSYNVTLDLCGAVYGGDTTFSGVASITLPELTMQGYTFNGWSYNGMTYEAGIVDLTSFTQSNILFTAVWQAIEYNITFVGTTISGTFTLDNTADDLYAKYDIADNIAQRTGYTASWSIVIEARDMVVYPVYTPNTYTYEYQGVSGKYTYEYGMTIALSSAESLGLSVAAGYVFVGWSTGEEILPANALITMTYMPDGVLTLIPVYNEITYTATFCDDSGEKYVTFTYTDVANGNTVLSPEIESRSGCVAVWETYTLTYSDITVNAIYYEIVYTATYTYDATDYGTVFFTYNNIPEAIPDAPVVSGILAYWEDIVFSGSNVTVNLNTDTDSWYYIEFELETKLSYLSVVSLPETIYVSYSNSEQTALPNAIATGYNFVGWSYNGTTYNAGDIVTELCGDHNGKITFIAEFELETYSIIFKNGDASYSVEYNIENAEGFTVDLDAVTVELPSIAGYTASWTYTIPGCGYGDVYAEVVYKPITYYIYATDVNGNEKIYPWTVESAAPALATTDGYYWVITKDKTPYVLLPENFDEQNRLYIKQVEVEKGITVYFYDVDNFKSSITVNLSGEEITVDIPDLNIGTGKEIDFTNSYLKFSKDSKESIESIDISEISGKFNLNGSFISITIPTSYLYDEEGNLYSDIYVYFATSLIEYTLYFDETGVSATYSDDKLQFGNFDYSLTGYDVTWTYGGESVTIGSVDDNYSIFVSSGSALYTDMNAGNTSLKFTSVLTAKEYGIVFMQGETELTENTVTYGNTYAISDFVKEPDADNGYTFDGWQGANGTVYTDYITITSDLFSVDDDGNTIISLTAVFALIEYTAEFIGTDGTVISTVSYTIKDNILEEPAVLEKIGYIGSWVDYTLLYTGETVTVLAEYTPISYTVKFNGSDEVFMAYYGTNYEITVTAQEKEWYTFAGWGYNGMIVESVYNLTTVNGEVITLEAEYVLSDYTISFMAKSEGSEDNYAIYTCTYNYESKDETVYVPKLPAGYVAWAVTDSLTGKDIDIYPVAFSENTIVEYYDVNNNFVTAVAVTDKSLAKQFVAKLTEKLGYEIVWTKDDNSNYYVTYKAIEYTITYVVYSIGSDGAVTDSIYKTIDVTYTVENYNVESPSFDSISYGSESYKDALEYYTVKWDMPDIVCGDYTVYPVYTPKVYTVIFHASNSSDEANNGEYTYTFIRYYTIENLSVALPEIPYFEGQVNTLWQYGGNEFDGTISRSVFAELCDFDVYASYSTEYTVIYEDYDGSEISVITVGYEEEFTIPSATRTGYTFAYWTSSVDDNCYYENDPVSQLTKGTSVTFTAHYTENSYTVEFDSNGGISVDSPSVRYTETFSLTSTTRTNYQFMGWEYDGVTYQEGDEFSMLNAEDGGKVKFTAVWENCYTIVYNANNGSTSASSATVYYSQSYTLASASTTTRTGYTFAGWKYNGKTYNGGDVVSKLTTTAGATVTMEAQWNINSYKVTISASNTSYKIVTSSGTTVTNGLNVDYNTELTITCSANDGYKDPVCAYSYTGHSETLSSGAKVQMPAYDVTFAFSSTESKCIAAGTMITLADGSKKAVEDVLDTDILLVYSHETGTYEAAAILFVDRDEWIYYSVLNLTFSNGTTVKVIGDHGFFDLTLNKYVYIDETNYAEYIGHSFYSGDITDGVYTPGSAVLTNGEITCEYTGSYSIITVYYMNYYVDGFLSMPADTDLLVNYFIYGENLKYDEVQMAEDIETYGLYTYDDFAKYVPEEVYECFPAQYFKVAVGKGLVTFDEIVNLIYEHLARYGYTLE